MSVGVDNSWTLWNAFSCGLFQTQTVSFFKSSTIGCSTSVKFGGGNFSIASILSLLGYTPLSYIMCPKYRMLLFLNSHFMGLILFPILWLILMFLPVFFLSCSSIVLPRIKMSSIITWNTSISFSNSVILRWKFSGAEDIPKGNLLKQNLLNGVVKVVSNRLSSSNGIWSNLPAASNFEHFRTP